MASNDPWAQRREAAESARTQALEKWRQTHPELADSETHRTTFLNGYEAAAGPLPATRNEVTEALARGFQTEAEAKRSRLSALPEGTCPECEGAGEFVGATHITRCDACNGTGFKGGK